MLRTGRRRSSRRNAPGVSAGLLFPSTWTPPRGGVGVISHGQLIQHMLAVGGDGKSDGGAWQTADIPKYHNAWQKLRELAPALPATSLNEAVGTAAAAAYMARRLARPAEVTSGQVGRPGHAPRSRVSSSQLPASSAGCISLTADSRCSTHGRVAYAGDEGSRTS